MSKFYFFYILYKDIKKLIKRHKFSFILIIIFILIFIFSKYEVLGYSIGSNDYSYDVDLNNFGITVDSNGYYIINNQTTTCNGYIVNYSIDSNYYYILFVNKDTCYWTEGTGRYMYIHFSPSTPNNYCQYRYVNGSLNFIKIATFTSTDFLKSDKFVSASFDVYDGNGTLIISGGRQNPYILNTITDLTGLLSDTITIESGSYQNYPITFSITQGQVGSSRYYTVYNTVLDSSSPFYNSIGSSVFYEIPISVFRSYLVKGYSVNYSILQNQDEEFPYIDTIRTIYTPELSEESDTDKINNIINNNTSLILSQQQQLLNQEKEIADNQKETNDFLKDDNFDNSDLNIPTDDTEDITENGINNIFNMIYNGFTSGNATNIVIPIPFTNKNITINSNLTSQVLNSNGFSWLKSIIEMFWWYLISVFIVKDISKKINKIKSGDFENIETNNIKEDML